MRKECPIDVKDYIGMLEKLPNLILSSETNTCEEYYPSLYRYKNKYYIEWVSSENITILKFKGDTLKSVINKAYKYCVIKNYINAKSHKLDYPTYEDHLNLCKINDIVEKIETKLKGIHKKIS